MLEISSEPRRLSDLLADAAGRLGVSVERGKPVSHPYQQIVNLRAPAAVIRWADSEVDPRLDTLIDRRKLQAAGEVINLALITISREAAW
jgi:hypothetical protein